MASLLNRKLLRDVTRMRSQVFAIVLVVACGVAQLVTNFTAFRSLRNAQSEYYRQYRFADVFASVKRAPDSLLRQIQAIPGVRDIEPRIVHDLTLDVPDLEEPATGRAVSIPEAEQPLLNRLHIRRGRYIEAGKADEILVSESFADANHLRLGTTIGAVISGRWRRLLIVGVALSPEYIYQIKPGDLFPDNKRFGVIWIGRKSLAAAFDLDGAFNDLSLTLERNAGERAVIDELDRVLRPYGGYGAYGRNNQVSHTFISDEIRQNRVFGMIVPAIFLGLAGFLISTVLIRLVGIERDQIGLLKAFGFGNAAVSMHYMKLAALIITLGWLLGIALGSWWARAVSETYKQFYHFPELRFFLQPATLALTYAVVATTAAAGCLGAVRRVVTLPPAEAMRPQSPVSFRAGFLERLGVSRWLSFNGRMIIRNLGRYPVKAVLSVLGIALGTSVLLVGYYFQDALYYMADVQFRAVQRENETVIFQTPQNNSALYEVAQLPGILRAEPVRMVAARLRNGYRERRIALTGLSLDGRLRRIVGQSGQDHQLPANGLVLTEKLAEILDVRQGDTVTVEAIEGRRPVKMMAVAGIVDELLGLSAYINIEVLNDFMFEGPTASGAFLLVDSGQQAQLYSALKERPAVAGVSSRKAAVASFEETLAKTTGKFAYILVLFATVIVFAAVYNAGRIALSERSRELASLCVLGFSRNEVAVVVIGEQATLAATAIPLGLGIGYLIASWLSWVYTLEMFRIPLVISSRSYFVTLVSVTVSAALSALVVHRRISRLNLVAAIKTRE
jgi:putative ABC transport system permease protein